MRIGVEVGGTFTDLVLEQGGRLSVVKVPSTPSEPDRGALQAISQCGVDLRQLDELVHGSTVATNAIIERKGARMCLLVSSGMRDLLALQRHNRRRIYDLHYAKPEPVVRRADTFEIPERIAADGTVVVELDQHAASAIIEEQLNGADYDAVAICFLNSYANPAHEETVAGMVREHFPDLPITCSADVNREFREYERCSTTVLSAYVQPVMASYLSRFVGALQTRGYRGSFSVMQSNGGRLPAQAMSKNAISALFSGPAAGVVGAVAAAQASGFKQLITLDMGGTSTDVCLIEDGKPTLTGLVEIDGLPVKTSVIDMVTVGAGGGSIVWVDDGDMLRVGPQSAGAEPGPAGYARGGTLPTITDAHLVRGTLQADALLGGEMSADLGAAQRSFAPVAKRLGLTIEAAADSAIRVAEANIVRAIQRVSTERGRDPRRYALVPFGGAGPMIAARLAEELNIETVITPANAGVLSAFGLLVSDYVHFETLTRRITVNSHGLEAIRKTVVDMSNLVKERLTQLGLAAQARFDVVLEMRYVGQAFEIPVTLPADMLLATAPGGGSSQGPGQGSSRQPTHRDLLGQADESSADGALDELIMTFREAHHRVFEFDHGSGGQCEVVSFRVSAAIPPAQLPTLSAPTVTSTSVTEIEIVEHEQRQTCVRQKRGALRSFQGPSLVEDDTSTLFVPSGWQAQLDDANNLILKRQG
jgi:N-methylhydantoinase A